jgi:acyl-CoA synthetase (AMP-forming)/AMP-acid ligase II
VGGLGVLLRCAWTGARAVLVTRFDPTAFTAQALAGEVTVASMVPTMLLAVLDELGEAPWPETLRTCMLGGAPVPPALVARCPAAIATYGLTEAASTVTVVPLQADAETRSSCGYPLPGTALRIVDDAGEPLPPGEVGLVSLKGPGVMRGYRHDAAATGRVLDAQGWLSTGDYGFLDARGRLHLCARREDLIISGGENIYPAEVEFALADHPAIAAASVVGRAHPRWGEAPVAFLVAKGNRLSPEALDSHLETRLARFKRPRAIAWLEALPLLPNGKVDRAALKARAASEEHALEW